jgi:hypothetical protein
MTLLTSMPDTPVTVMVFGAVVEVVLVADCCDPIPALPCACANDGRLIPNRPPNKTDRPTAVDVVIIALRFIKLPPLHLPKIIDECKKQRLQIKQKNTKKLPKEFRNQKIISTTNHAYTSTPDCLVEVLVVAPATVPAEALTDALPLGLAPEVAD